MKRAELRSFSHFQILTKITYFEFDNFDQLLQIYSERRETPKLVNFQVFC